MEDLQVFEPGCSKLEIQLSGFVLLSSHSFLKNIPVFVQGCPLMPCWKASSHRQGSIKWCIRTMFSCYLTHNSPSPTRHSSYQKENLTFGEESKRSQPSHRVTMHLLIMVQGLSKSLEANPSISTQLSTPVIGALWCFSESNRWIYNMARMTGEICLLDWKTKRSTNTKSQWACFLSSGETQGAITSEQRKRRHQDSQYQCKSKSAPSSVKHQKGCGV